MRFIDAGESHGRMLAAIIEGIPSNIEVDTDFIDHELEKRQSGFGRGGRMKIEKDRVEIATGMRNGKTTGAPVTMIIKNIDHVNWAEEMDGDIREAVTRPRPGHADLNGVLKYNLKDIRDVIERASARETAMRTAVGAFAAVFLKQFGIRDRSRVIQIGRVIDRTPSETLDFDYIENSQVMCSNPECEQDMMEEIKRAYEKGDSLGGRFEVVISNVPIGIGSYTQWDRKLDTRLAGAVMSIQGIKAVEMGNGFESALIPGSKFHDEICYTKSRGFYRLSNNAGGVEGGISNGEDIIVRASMKPIPTLRIPLRSVDIFTGEPAEAVLERSDVCAVTAAGIVARNACMWEIACSFLDKFGGDSIEEVTANYQRYISGLCCRNKK